MALLAAAILAPSAAADPLSFMPPQYIDDTFPGGEPVIQVDTVHHTLVYSSHEGTTHIYREGRVAVSVTSSPTRTTSAAA